MGVIKRQGIKQGIVSYGGAFIGLFSTFFVYPLDNTVTGILQFILSTSTFLMPILGFGFLNVAIKFFAEFKNSQNGHNGLLSFLLLISGLSVLGLSLLFTLVKPWLDFLMSFIGMDTAKIFENGPYILALALILVWINVLVNYISNFFRVVVPNIFTNIFVKIFVPALVLATYINFLSIEQIKIGLLLGHFIVLVALIFYSMYLKEWHLKINFSFLKEKNRLSRMFSFAGFSVLGSIGSVLATRIDYIMVTTLAGGFFSTGIYHFANSFSGVIAIPFLAFRKISAPLIASSLQGKDYEKVGEIYRRSSLDLLVVGLTFFFAAWISIDYLFAVTPKPEELRPVKYVVFFLGIAKLIDMATGLNDLIIGYSIYYRFNVIAVLILGVINVAANLLLIPAFGITGVAVATFISFTIFNIAKLIFVWVKFQIHPFTNNTLIVILIALIVFLILSILPDLNFVLLNIVVRSGLFVGLFGGVVLFFDLAPDLTNLFWEVWRKFF